MSDADYQPIQKTLQKIRYLFTLSGLKLNEKRSPETNPVKYRAVFLFNITWFLLDCLGACSWLIIGLIQKLSFTELSFVAPCLAFSVLGITKSVYYTFYDSYAYELLADLIQLETTRQTSNQMDSERKLKAEESYYLKRVLNVLNVMYILLITLYNVGPLVGTAVTYYRTENLKLFLPFLDVYPFDALSLKYWPYAYIHQIWSVCLVLFFVGSVDCFLLTCCTYIRIQFRLIQLDIEHIVPTRELPAGEVRDDSIHNIQTKLNDLIRRHQRIIRLSTVLRKMYSESILINVITSSMIICLTGFNATFIQEVTLVMPSLAFLITSLLQVFCLCLFGDLLMSSSEDVSTAVYASRWYLGDKETSKKLLFILARTQTPCKLTASGFMEVNLRAFMKILSTSWSYFALLKTVYGQ